LKLKPFKLNAIVEIPKAVNQIPTTGQAAKKKCNERELLNEGQMQLCIRSFKGTDSSIH
jgi:hypothetical protein